LGCGHGELSIALIDRGARVTGIDISGGMVEVARRRVDAFRPGAEAAFVVGDATAMPFGDEMFDVIVGKWVLHHLEVAPGAAEIRRLLAPGGAALFIENQGTNPLLRFARDHLAGRFGIPRYGSEDEHPLVGRDYDALGAEFSAVELSYPDFFFFTLFDRQIARQQHAVVSQVCRALDSAIYDRVPALRRYSFHVLIGLTP
jgi:SAM-dependent methyltransferase